jgi:threonine/homoserine/homoserine lactone efflux protein
MALGAVTAYAPREGYVLNVVFVALVFAAINLPCVAAWTGFGLALRRVLGQPRVLRLFNVSMGLLLAASLYPTLRDRL